MNANFIRNIAERNHKCPFPPHNKIGNTNRKMTKKSVCKLQNVNTFKHSILEQF